MNKHKISKYVFEIHNPLFLSSSLYEKKKIFFVSFNKINKFFIFESKLF